MESLVPELRAHFDHLQSKMSVFSRYGFQSEGWFKAEMIAFLDAALARKRIEGFDREVSFGSRQKVDLRVDLDGERHWIELKHWMIGEQRGVTWRAPHYFGDGSGFGLTKDIDKLLSVPEPDHLWMLVLVTANPGLGEWCIGLVKFHEKFAPRRIESHTDPEAFPESYCLGLFEVER